MSWFCLSLEQIVRCVSYIEVEVAGARVSDADDFWLLQKQYTDREMRHRKMLLYS